MLEAIREKFETLTEGINQKMTAFSDSVDLVQKDVQEVRSFFSVVAENIGNIFNFLGKETSILIFLTLIFLTVLNFIPFFFFDKKVRYYLGLAFGVFIGVIYSYSFLGVSKYIFVMLLPIIIEVCCAFLLKKTGGAGVAFFKKISLFFVSFFGKIFKKIIPHSRNKEKDSLK